MRLFPILFLVLVSGCNKSRKKQHIVYPSFTPVQKQFQKVLEEGKKRNPSKKNVYEYKPKQFLDIDDKKIIESISVNKASLTDFASHLSGHGGVNITVSEESKDKLISYKGEKVTLRDIARVLYKIYNVEMVRDESNSRQYFIVPAKYVTMTFSLGTLDMQRKGRTQTQGNPFVGSQTGAVNTSMDSSYQDSTYKDAENLAKSIVKEYIPQTEYYRLNEFVQCVPSTGQLMVTAPPAAMPAVCKVIEEFCKALNTSCKVEIRVIEITLKNSSTSGPDLSKLEVNLNTSLMAKGLQSGQFKITGGGVSLVNEMFNLAIDTLKESGEIKSVLSIKEIMTSGGASVIKMGDTGQTLGGVKTVNSPGMYNNSSQQTNVEFTPTFSGQMISIRCLIDSNTKVGTFHIATTTSTNRPDSINFTYEGQNNLMPINISSSRDTDSVVKIPNGGFRVITQTQKNANAKSTSRSVRNISQTERTLVMYVMHYEVIEDSDEYISTLQGAVDAAYGRTPGIHDENSYSNSEIRRMKIKNKKRKIKRRY